jgi:hypothetical protein
MTSTRNKNTDNDYKLEQQTNFKILNTNLYEGFNVPDKEIIPSIGAISSKRNRNALASNSVDIESSLFGINSTNLVKPAQPIEPLFKNIQEYNFFDRPNEIIMPYPLVFNNNNRPKLI